MNKSKSERVIKHEHYPCCQRPRMKAIKVHTSIGPTNAFKQFYQSGGRDLEQYCQWLETLSKSKQLSIPSMDSNQIEDEPIDINPNIYTISLSSSSSSSVHHHHFTSLPRPTCTQSLLNPMRHSSISTGSSYLVPSSIYSPSQTTSFKSHDHSHIPTVDSPFINWSVIDVGQFIEKHFPEKKISQKFIQQKIDGRTLPLLTEDHLTKNFKMKLGPALYLLALISDIQHENV